MECPYCSSEVFDGDTYCNACGEDMPRPDEGVAYESRCLSCGKMHLNEGFRCDACMAKEQWKPEDWEKFRSAPVLGPAAKLLMFATVCLVALFFVTMVTAREVKVINHGRPFHWTTRFRHDRPAPPPPVNIAPNQQPISVPSTSAQ